MKKRYRFLRRTLITSQISHASNGLHGRIRICSVSSPGHSNDNAKRRQYSCPFCLNCMSIDACDLCRWLKTQINLRPRFFRLKACANNMNPGCGTSAQSSNPSRLLRTYLFQLRRRQRSESGSGVRNRAFITLSRKDQPIQRRIGLFHRSDLFSALQLIHLTALVHIE